MQAGSDYAWNSRDHLAARVSPTNDEDLAAIARGLSRRSKGYVSSVKNEATLPWRSRIERDLMRVFELDHGIVSYVSMPEKVELVLGGKHHRVVPALGAMTVRGPMVFDVFRSDGPQSPARLAIAQAVGDIYARRSVTYRCLPPARVRVEPRMTNVTYARSWKGTIPNQATRIRILELVARDGETWTVERLRKELGDEANGLFHMAIRRNLWLDLSSSDPHAMRVSMGEGF